MARQRVSELIGCSSEAHPPAPGIKQRHLGVIVPSWIVAWPPPNHRESLKIWPIDHRRIWHVEPLSRFIWLLRVPQQDLIATLRHIPRGLCVLGVSSVTARLARLAAETLEPRFEVRSI